MNNKSLPQNHFNKPRPFVKWVGGKRQLLDILDANAPSRFNQYFEPFIGGGAFFFFQQLKQASISDLNPELINCYQIIKDDVQSLLSDLSLHQNNECYFKEIRAKKIIELADVQRASRFIFLNKTCFNGLYRENKSGQFNTPFGHYPNPKIIDTENLLAVNAYLNRNDISIRCCDYQSALDSAVKNDFVYFDPPYAPTTDTAKFTSYTKSGFDLTHQEALAAYFETLTKRGVACMLSNANVPIIHALYKQFNIQVIHATRSINCKGEKRGKQACELLITNY